MNPVVVVGGGPAGLEAARGIAELGQPVVLVEKRDTLGGTPIAMSYASLTPHHVDAETAIGEMVNAVRKDPLVKVLAGSEIVAAAGDPPSLGLTVKTPKGEQRVTAGAVIVATGFEHFDPGRETQIYGYYEYDDVITLVDAERMLKAKTFVRPSDGKPPKQVCFIQCVGSRDRQIGNLYCSKVCCGIASHEAIEIRRLLPECKVFIFYIDMRMYGFWEDEIYWPAQEKYKVNYIRGIVTEITKRGDTLVVKGEDTTLGRPMEVPMDMVILSVGMEPSAGTKQMAKLLELPLESHGFIATTGAPLNTVATARPGVFAVGAATGPADLEDSISSGGAGAMKAVAYLRKAANSAA